MANLAYALEHTNGAGSDEKATSTKPLTPAQAMAQGFNAANSAPTDNKTDATSKGADTSQSPANASTTTPQDATTANPTAATPAEVQKEKTVYMQVKGMLDKLDKKGKQRILAAIQKQLGSSTPSSTTANTTTASASNSPFGQMASQLTQQGNTDTSKVGNATKSSTGGKTQQTTTGTVHTKNRNNPNIKRRTPKVAPVQATEPTPVTAPTEPAKQWKGRKTKDPAIAESKRVIKVWGQK
jgi:hypothetical protein